MSGESNCLEHIDRQIQARLLATLLDDVQPTRLHGWRKRGTSREALAELYDMAVECQPGFGKAITRGRWMSQLGAEGTPRAWVIAMISHLLGRSPARLLPLRQPASPRYEDVLAALEPLWLDRSGWTEMADMASVALTAHRRLQWSDPRSAADFKEDLQRLARTDATPDFSHESWPDTLSPLSSEWPETEPFSEWAKRDIRDRVNRVMATAPIPCDQRMRTSTKRGHTHDSLWEAAAHEEDGFQQAIENSTFTQQLSGERPLRASVLAVVANTLRRSPVVLLPSAVVDENRFQQVLDAAKPDGLGEVPWIDTVNLMVDLMSSYRDLARIDRARASELACDCHLRSLAALGELCEPSFSQV